MRIWILPLLVLGLTACEPRAPSQPPSVSPAAAEAQASPAAESVTESVFASEAPPFSLPADVVAFEEDRGSCEHWLGEAAYDDERAKQIIDAYAKYCKGSDAKLAKLRKDYKDNVAVMAVLSEYEDRIELSPPKKR